MANNHTSDNWASFRRILEQLLNTTETQAELLKSLLEEGDDAHHLDFIQQLQFDEGPEAVAMLKTWRNNPRRMVAATNRNRLWTEQEHNDLKVLFRYGLTDEAIGEFLGRSKDSVERRRGVLGLRRDA